MIRFAMRVAGAVDGPGGVMRRWSVVFVLVVCAVCGCAGCGGANAKTSAPSHGVRHRGTGAGQRVGLTGRLRLGAFAGYAEDLPVYEPVTSVQASFVVPRIAPGSATGEAATWIGAGGAGASSLAPFIQVGVSESRVARASGVRDLYLAVWSDTRKHFELMPLFRVVAGDRMRAELDLSHGRWTVSIVDVRTGAGRRFATSDQGRDVFGNAQIFQEDPTENSGTGQLVRYPRLSRVAFDDVQVDSGPLNYRWLLSSWMTENGQLLAPGGVYASGFTLHTIRPSTVGVRYLQIIQSLYQAINAYNAELSGWSRSSPHSQIVSSSEQLETALTDGIRLLNQTRWPSSVAVPVGILASDAQSLLASTRQVQTATPDQIDQSRSAWENELVSVDGSESTTADALNLPDSAPRS